jgi:hypothetical protein
MVQSMVGMHLIARSAWLGKQSWRYLTDLSLHAKWMQPDIPPPAFVKLFLPFWADTHEVVNWRFKTLKGKLKCGH